MADGPSAFDTRPLRITLFPEFPQVLLIYVPDEQTLWLPPLETPFDLDKLCDALDAKDVPHDTREGDRNRWWKNMRQSADMDAGMKGQRECEAKAVERVKVHLSSEATTLDKQRIELLDMRDKIVSEMNQLKAKIGTAKAHAATKGVYQKIPVFRGWELRLAQLNDSLIAVSRKLGENKAAIKAENVRTYGANNISKEKRFVEKAKRFLNREQYMSIWDEIHAEDAKENTNG